MHTSLANTTSGILHVTDWVMVFLLLTIPKTCELNETQDANLIKLIEQILNMRH